MTTDTSNQQGGQLVISIEDMLQAAPSLPSREYCIYKVPVNLRSKNEAAYTPQILSIGPLHRKDKRLQQMEAYKLSFLNNLLRRKPNIHLDDYVKTLSRLEEQVRGCYFDEELISDIISNDFVKMMLLDGCFIVELFNWLFNSSEIQDCPTDIEELPEPYACIVSSDLLLFENQLPFFVLEHLFNIINDKSCKGSSSFFDLAGHFFYDQRYVKEEQIDRLKNSGYQVKHFLDLLLNCYIPLGTDRQMSVKVKKSRKAVLYLPSATELCECGIRLQKSSTSDSFLDITFKENTYALEIPSLFVTRDTELLFGNMIAMGKCHVGNTAYITHYGVLLDFLVREPNDVALLISYRIIDEHLGSDTEVT